MDQGNPSVIGIKARLYSNEVEVRVDMGATGEKWPDCKGHHPGFAFLIFGRDAWQVAEEWARAHGATEIIDERTIAQRQEGRVPMDVELENLASRAGDAARTLEHTGYATTAANLRKAVHRFRLAFKADRRWADAITQDRETHTARLARGADRLAADAGISRQNAAGLLVEALKAGAE